MKNTSTLNKKLKSYSALAGSVLAVGSTADAQVVYTDVNPDSVIAMNTFYELDLNNDGIKDFTLGQFSGTTSGISFNVAYVGPMAALNAIDTAGGSGLAAAVNSGFSVDSTLNWVDSAGAASGYASLLALAVPILPAYNMGNFLGQTGKFLPLRFDLEGAMYYGWVRLTVPSSATSITVIDYAYRNWPDAPSITGLTTDVGIAESALNGHVNVFAYNKDITVTLDKNITAEGTITVRNTLGQTIKSVAVTGSEMHIDMKDVKDGAYMVTIAQPSGAYTKKVVLK
jgi:hypothetical protein